MRYALIFIFLFWGCASIDKGDMVFTGLLMVDYVQTKKILKDPDIEELNPVVSSESVDIYFPMCLIGYFTIKRLLPESLRAKWSYFWIGAEGATDIYNELYGAKK